MKSKFSIELDKFLKTQTKTQTKLAEDLGYHSGTIFSHLRLGKCLPSKIAYKKLIELWPAFKGTLDHRKLRDRQLRGKKQDPKKSVIATEMPAVEKVHTLDDFKAALNLSNFVRSNKEAPLVLETLEYLCRKGMGFHELVTVMKSMEVTNGRR